MKRSPRLIFGSVLVAGLMATGAGWAQSTGSGTSGSSSGTIHPSPKGTEGGSRSERTGESDVPLPKGSPQSGTVDMGKSGGTTGSSGSTGTSSSSGSTGMSSSSGSTATTHRASSSNVKEVQQALKDKGYDPGPIDGRMGAKTKEALKSFQSASNLSATGTLNSQTAEKLGVQSSSSSPDSSSMGSGKSSSSSPSGSGSMRSNDTRSNSNTTKGKDTDQPNK